MLTGLQHLCSPYFLLLLPRLLLSIQTTQAALADIDNSLIGTPEINCHPDTIEMHFRTKRPFKGKIYVQGHYSNPDCRVDYSQLKQQRDSSSSGVDPEGGIRLHHGSCDMDRQRMSQPAGGMQFSTILVISFHPLFITKTDRAFHINCFYKEEVRAVTAGMTVSEQDTIPVQNDMPVPVCQYTIRKDELDGPMLRYAKVGDQVVHRWECDSDSYGMLVHSCYVEDGQGEKQLVIDERGCHIDRFVLGDPTYTKALNMAYRESYVFKFADKVGVRFSCEIKLCLKSEGGCTDITPPSCSDSPSSSYQSNELSDEVAARVPARVPYLGSANASSEEDDTYLTTREHRTVAKRSTNHSSSTGHHPQRMVNADLISQYLYVLDSVDEKDTDAEHLEGYESNAKAHNKHRSQSSSAFDGLFQPRRSRVCLSTSVFVSILLIVTMAFGLASALLLQLGLRQYREIRRRRRSHGNIRRWNNLSVVTGNSSTGSVTPPSMLYFK